ncbi:hypothetical protein NQ176_g6121 [Zarea fungicola]|uniref:Uncharacterized protein n=1 Tax=Zarea fungicola TaxID=93591 RepID=A0ACC1N4W8_9HYPO|nr:hypothetical protein NQ176_g6121 [Lecanicillium fungicola]
MSSAREKIYEPGVVNPGLPAPASTTSFWHSDPHPLANHQAPWPVVPVDVVVIGSGITAMSLARTLLRKSPNLAVVIIEARSLCSGATGRNGGHCKTMTFANWVDRKQCFGVREACRITELEHAHLDAMAAAIHEDGVACDLVMTEGVDAYFDQASFDRAVRALKDMKAYLPQIAAKHKIYTDKEHIKKTLKLSESCVGAVTIPAASLWPYKWVTGVLGR